MQQQNNILFKLKVYKLIPLSSQTYFSNEDVGVSRRKKETKKLKSSPGCEIFAEIPNQEVLINSNLNPSTIESASY